ncbi:MAG: MarR family transcriptional regulator [Nocardioides sp.]
MQRGPVDHDSNVIGAAALLLSDRVRTAVEPISGARGGASAAVTALLGWADGARIDALAAGLRLSHSRAVRVVDGLERDGYAVRRASATDGRVALVYLTQAGRETGERALSARADALTEALAPLGTEERKALANAARSILRHAAVSRPEARALCRYCDVEACGHHIGRCPSTGGADARDGHEHA